MQQRLVLFVGLVAAAVLVPLSSATSCPSVCRWSRCAPLQLSECKAGIARDICHCCLVCAKALGEECGGFDRVYGTCGKNLTCISSRGPFGRGVCMRTTAPRIPTTATSRPANLSTKTSSVHPNTTTAPASRNCLQAPKCTVSFCNDNRSKICRVNS